MGHLDSSQSLHLSYHRALLTWWANYVWPLGRLRRRWWRVSCVYVCVRCVYVCRVRALRTGDTLGRAAPWWSLPLSPLLFLYFYISMFLNLLHRRHFENRCIVFETLDLENEWIESKNLCSENRWIVFLKSYIFKISGILSFAFAAGCHRFFSPLTLVIDQ